MDSVRCHSNIPPSSHRYFLSMPTLADALPMTLDELNQLAQWERSRLVTGHQALRTYSIARPISGPARRRRTDLTIWDVRGIREWARNEGRHMSRSQQAFTLAARSRGLLGTPASISDILAGQTFQDPDDPTPLSHEQRHLPIWVDLHGKRCGMKILQRIVSRRERLPFGYAPAWQVYYMDGFACYPVGLHLVMSCLHAAYWYVVRLRAPNMFDAAVKEAVEQTRSDRHRAC